MVLKQPGDAADGRKFTYDYVYGVQSTQRQVYDDSAFGLVESVLEGYNGKNQELISAGNRPELFRSDLQHSHAACLIN